MEMVMMTQMGAVNFIAPSQCKLGGASGLPHARIGFKVRVCLLVFFPPSVSLVFLFLEGVFGCKM
jgi:hypothetical protein